MTDRTIERAAQNEAFAWHAAKGEAVLQRLDASRHGLSESEAKKRLERDGPNMAPSPPRVSSLKRFLLQFHNVLIYVLIASAMISVALGHPVDAAVIAAVVIVNAVIGYIQEGRAEQALDAIRAMIDPKASVLRDGKRVTIPAASITRGDIVLFESGDRIPADVRILHCRNLRMDESLLTGESAPVEKRADALDPSTPLADRMSMAYSGCFVASGQGVGVAVEIGAGTQLGRIGALLGSVDAPKTPLLEQMDRFGRQVTWAILAFCILALPFAIYIRGFSAEEAFMVVVGLAVAAIPEGLPAMLTIALSIGVQGMASRNAIVRKLPAVETLGSVSVICSDKTGTLTRNEMTARSIALPGGRYEAAGEGYAPNGCVTREGASFSVSEAAQFLELAKAGVLCNDSELHEHRGGWRVEGDPMEGALLALGGKAGLDPRQVRAESRRRDEIPFDSQHRFMATLHSDGDRAFIIVKGAPERVIDMCAAVRSEHGDAAIDLAAWRAKADCLAAEGQRVLAFATAAAEADLEALSFNHVETGLVLLGLVGFMDPPRAEAVKAIAECQSAGVRVVMITGDHAVTAREIGRMLGLAKDPVVKTGQDIDGYDDAALARVVQDTVIFARTTPEHKLRLVSAMQEAGLTIAMTGDGVNDAPALKRADVGVAMGVKGTEAAKDASEMVLADDNFASIVAAVKEGRRIYDNIVKVIAWTLPTNGGQALTILAAILFGATLPITPVQILWVNLVCAVALGTTLAFEPAEPGIMNRPPRSRSAPLLSRELMWRIFFVSVLFVIGAFGMFEWAQWRGLPLEVARTLVVNTLVTMGIFYLFSVRFVHGLSLTLQGALGTPAVFVGVGVCVAAQIAFTYAPLFNRIFGSAPVSLMEGAAVAAIGVALLVVVEAEKAVRTRFS